VAGVVGRDTVRAGRNRDATEHVQLAARVDAQDRERRTVTAGNVEVPERRRIGDDIDAVAGCGLPDLLSVLGNIEDGGLALVTADEQQTALLSYLLATCQRLSTTAQLMFAKNASMYFAWAEP
jgi:hypothetical protein